MDIFDQNEVSKELFEISRAQDYTEVIPFFKPVKDRQYLNIFLRADNQSNIYKRISYDVLSYLGDLGGLLDAILMIGFTFTSFFASKLFRAALINQFYKVQQYDQDFSPYQEPEFSDKSQIEESISFDDHKNSNNIHIHDNFQISEGQKIDPFQTRSSQIDSGVKRLRSPLSQPKHKNSRNKVVPQSKLTNENESNRYIEKVRQT